LTYILHPNDNQVYDNNDEFLLQRSQRFYQRNVLLELYVLLLPLTMFHILYAGIEKYSENESGLLIHKHATL